MRRKSPTQYYSVPSPPKHKLPKHKLFLKYCAFGRDLATLFIFSNTVLWSHSNTVLWRGLSFSNTVLWSHSNTVLRRALSSSNTVLQNMHWGAPLQECCALETSLLVAGVCGKASVDAVVTPKIPHHLFNAADHLVAHHKNTQYASKPNISANVMKHMNA